MSAKNRQRLGSPLRLHGSFELFGKSGSLVWKSIWVFAPLYALPLLFSFHSWEWTPSVGSQNGHWWTIYSWLGSGLGATVPYYLWYAFVGSSFIWFIFVVAVGSIVQIMLQQAQLESTERKPLDFIKLWKSTKGLYWQMLGLYFVIGLYVAVGLFLFVIPGLIMLRRYFLAPYVMLDTKCGIKTAMERSSEISKPYSSYIWGMIAIMVGIGMLNAIAYLGWFVALLLGMFYSVAPALRYQELKHVHGGRQRPEHHHEQHEELEPDLEEEINK